MSTWAVGPCDMATRGACIAILLRNRLRSHASAYFGDNHPTFNMAVEVEHVDTIASGNVLLRSVASLRDLDTGEALAKWVRHELQAVFPHAAFLIGLWRIRPAGMAPVKYYAWNLPVDHLPAFRQPDGLYHAALLHGWLKRGEPLLLDDTRTPTVAAHSGKPALHNVAVHGGWDYSRQHASCFCFHGIPGQLGEEHRLLLYLLVPHLHTALIRVLHQGRLGAPRLRTHQTLTPRELEVLDWVCEGKTSPEIAAILGRARSTIRNQIQSILVKMKVNTRAQAAAKAMKKGLVEPRHPNSQFGPLSRGG